MEDQAPETAEEPELVGLVVGEAGGMVDGGADLVQLLMELAAVGPGCGYVERVGEVQR